MRDGKHVVLCIDDEAAILDSLRCIIEAGGYVFEGASTAEETLGAFERHRPDIVLLDLMMEKEDTGLSLVSALHAKDGAVPIYLLSSAGNALCLNADSTELGFSGVLQKPVEPEELLGILRARLRS